MFKDHWKSVRHAALGLVVASLLSACTDEDAPQLPDVRGLHGTIAFVCEYDGGDNDELCLINADRSNLRRITHNPGPDRAPTWSPDGTTLVFNSRRDPHAGWPQIYGHNVTAGSTWRISDGFQEDQRASWTPDGSAVVFQRGDFISGYELFRQSATSGAVEQLTNNPGRLNAAGSYSPDGRSLVLQSNRDVPGLFPFSTYVVDVETGEARRLAMEITASHDGPRWSPNGDRIVFSAGGNLYVIDLASDTVTAVTDDDFSDSSPAWSPDGSMLVFQSNRLDAGSTTIHVIDLETREIGVLAEGRTPVWSPVEF